MSGVGTAEHAFDVRHDIHLDRASRGRRNQRAAHLVKKPAIGVRQRHLTQQCEIARHIGSRANPILKKPCFVLFVCISCLREKGLPRVKCGPESGVD